jgi:site-specific DNA-methyltransferase (adenine-specific)
MPAARFHKARRDGEPSANRRYTDEGATNFSALPGERRFGGGSAARFFYCAKASQDDRNEGCGYLEPSQYSHDGRETPIDNAYQRNASNASNASNAHPTVKPTALMRYLVKLVTPPHGTVLDCFAGSFSTGKAAILEGFNFIGIEGEEEYCKIGEARLKWAVEERLRATAQQELFPV